LAAFACLTALSVAPPAGAAVPAFRSAWGIPASNGRGAIVYDAKNLKLVSFLEHAYRYPAPGQESRNFLFDSYPGLRVGGQSAWLNTVAPQRIEYASGTGIVHVVRSWQGLDVDEWHFQPQGLAENAAFTIVGVTRKSGSGAVDVFSLQNYHLGSGGPNPGADGEGMAWNAARDAYYEWGPSGVAFGHGSVAASSFHGASPNNPYLRLLAGQNLANDAGLASAFDLVCGFQQSMGDLPINASGYAGWYSVLATDADAQKHVDAVRAWIAGRTPKKILDDEIAAWAAWQKPVPMGASPREAELAKTSQAILRMGQVSEPGKPDGQIVASIAPGKWNIAWVRDMAYAVVALARSGHVEEARRAIAFQMGADVGDYQQYVGAPYQISVVRYYGNGKEETDFNQDGPNIEFDGFGLFLWELEEYVKASGDLASLGTWWPVVEQKIADVLVKLQRANGLIAADSSIWEVHWNGKQQQFAYTSITAAAGLCAASRLAKQAGKAAKQTEYLDAGRKIRDAIFTNLRGPDGTLAQSFETLQQGTGFLDAATVEAINWGLVHPRRRTSKATLASLRALVPPSGRGFMRNDDGDWYDSQEWVFVDFRANRALGLRGDVAARDALMQWNVDQGTENFGILSELHDRTTASYQGEAPMVGFGAGGYLLALLDRDAPGAPACGDYAAEPPEPDEEADAGADGGSFPVGDGGYPADDAGPTGPASSGGCSCDAAPRPGATGSMFAGLGLALAAVVRRIRRTR
jgi:MYXO-CTERM domain-containing protein